MTPRLALLVLPLLAGCTFQPGGGFGELTDARLSVALEPGAARDLGDGAILTDEGYAVAFDTLTLELGALQLQELQGATDVTFDPADPPDGYSLCHGGHCHSDAGELVAYEDIIAELSGGTAEYVSLAVAGVDDEVDLLAGADRTVAFDEAWLPMADLSRFALTTTGLTGTAVVTGGDLAEDEALELVVDLAFDDAFSVAVALPVDREHDPVISLDAAVLPGGTLLDGVLLSDLADEDGLVTLDDPTDSGPGQALFGALVSTAPDLTITRSQ